MIICDKWIKKGMNMDDNGWLNPETPIWQVHCHSLCLTHSLVTSALFPRAGATEPGTGFEGALRRRCGLRTALGPGTGWAWGTGDGTENPENKRETSWVPLEIVLENPRPHFPSWSWRLGDWVPLLSRQTHDFLWKSWVKMSQDGQKWDRSENYGN